MQSKNVLAAVGVGCIFAAVLFVSIESQTPQPISVIERELTQPGSQTNHRLDVDSDATQSQGTANSGNTAAQEAEVKLTEIQQQLKQTDVKADDLRQRIAAVEVAAQSLPHDEFTSFATAAPNLAPNKALEARIQTLQQRLADQQAE